MSRKYQKTTGSSRTRPPARKVTSLGGKKPVSRPATKTGSTRAGARRSAPARATSSHRSASRPTTPGPGRFRLLKLIWARINQRRLSGPAARPARPPSGGLLGKKTSPAPGLSLDRQLDLLGIALIFIGLPMLLSLFSVTHSGVTGGLLKLLSRAFGWGAYGFPITLIGIGMWLVLRSFERVPRISLERLAGLALLYVELLAILHYLNFPDSSTEAFSLAAQGQGGGYVGAACFQVLRLNLGWGGTAIAFLAWLVIGLTLTLDVAVIDLFRWVPPLILRFQDWWDERKNHSAPVLVGGASPAANPSLAAGPTAGSFPASSLFFNPAASPPAAWVLPPIEQILDQGSDLDVDDDVDRQRARLIEETLASFGAPVNVVEINRGPTVTQFGVEPDFIETRSGRTRVRVGKVASLADDLALALAAKTIRVQAPVPGKGYVGIEVPNDEIALVALRDVIESEAFRRLKSSLRFALGEDVAGNAVAADLSAMPHLLVAGATGSGKSVCVNAIISCLLLHNTPGDLRLIMVDPKRVELTGYNGIPHLLAPVVVELERVVGALQWVLREMDQRYHKLAQLGTRNIVEYNATVAARNEPTLPRLVVIIDELADLMMLAPEETERTITRLAQLARATGIHLIIATQRPSVDVVTGLIKANFPARIAFAVASGVDSRVILDQPGAERLLGRGDMLFQAPDAAAPIRLQGAFVSDAEIQHLVQYWQGFTGLVQTAPNAAPGVVDALPTGIPLKQIPLWDEMGAEEEKDPMLDEAIDLVRRQGRASVSLLQRRLRIGYTRAARIVETMQEKGIIGMEAGPQGFEVLDYGPAAPPVEEQ